MVLQCAKFHFLIVTHLQGIKLHQKGEGKKEMCIEQLFKKSLMMNNVYYSRVKQFRAWRSTLGSETISDNWTLF